MKHLTRSAPIPAAWRRLSVLLTLCLLFTSLAVPLPVMAESGTPTEEAVSDTGPAPVPPPETFAPPAELFVCDGDDHDRMVAISQEFLSGSTSLSSGRYCLTEDVTGGFFIGDKQNVTLCLNGHTLYGLNQSGVITYETLYVRPAILVLGSGTLTLCDCQGGGVVTNRNNPAVVLDDYLGDATLNLIGGRVESPTHTALAVRKYSHVYMYGGEVETVTLGHCSEMQIYGGTIERIKAHRNMNDPWSNDTTVGIHGGTLGSLDASECEATMTGGVITDSVSMASAGNFYLCGGLVKQINHGYGGLVLDGGVVETISLVNTSAVPRFTVNVLPPEPILVSTVGYAIYEPSVGAPVIFAELGEGVEDTVAAAASFYSDRVDRIVRYDDADRTLAFTRGADLWVGGVQVTDENHANVLGMTNADGQPTVVFEEDGCLHLYDAVIGEDGATRADYAIYSSQLNETFRVIFHGNSRLYGDRAAVAGVDVEILTDANATLTGGLYGLTSVNDLVVDGTLTAIGQDESGLVVDSLTLNGGTIIAEGGYYGVYSTYDITVYSGSLTATGHNGGYGIYVDNGNSALNLYGGQVYAAADGENACGVVADYVSVDRAELTVEVNGANTAAVYGMCVYTCDGGIFTATATGNMSYGLYVEYVDVYGGYLTAGADFCGLYCDYDVTVGSGVLAAEATDADGSAFAVADTMTLTGGTVIATGGFDGLWIGQALLISGGTLTAEGINGYGLEVASGARFAAVGGEISLSGAAVANADIAGGVDGMAILASTDPTGDGPVPYRPADFATYRYLLLQPVTIGKQPTAEDVSVALWPEIEAAYQWQLGYLVQGPTAPTISPVQGGSEADDTDYPGTGGGTGGGTGTGYAVEPPEPADPDAPTAQPVIPAPEEIEISAEAVAEAEPLSDADVPAEESAPSWERLEDADGAYWRTVTAGKDDTEARIVFPFLAGSAPVSFAYTVSSESGWDELSVYLAASDAAWRPSEGECLLVSSGEMSDTVMLSDLVPGTIYYLVAIYAKDSSWGEGEDAATIRFSEPTATMVWEDIDGETAAALSDTACYAHGGALVRCLITLPGGCTLTSGTVSLPEIERSATVTFVSDDGETLLTVELTEEALATFTFPAVPAKPGYYPGTWNKTADDLAEAIRGGVTAVTVSPVYPPIVTIVTVTVTGGVIADLAGFPTTGEVSVNTTLHIVAYTPAAGTVFAGWQDEKGTILSYNATYTLIADRALHITAVYVPVEEAPAPLGVATMTAVNRNESVNGLSFVAAFSVPVDGRIDFAGVVATSDAAKAENLTAETADYVRGRAQTEHAGRFTWTKSNAGDATWYVRAYLVYTDAKGVTHTVYSDLISAAYSEL